MLGNFSWEFYLNLGASAEDNTGRVNVSHSHWCLHLLELYFSGRTEASKEIPVMRFCGALPVSAALNTLFIMPGESTAANSGNSVATRTICCCLLIFYVLPPGKGLVQSGVVLSAWVRV